MDGKNSPDSWEKEALMAFERGEKEVSKLIGKGESRSLRFMEPLVIEERCLQCHSDQGYRLGDIRGGISITMPMESFFHLEQHQRSTFIYVITLIWIVGLGGILLGGRKILHDINARERSHRALLESESRMSLLLNSIPDLIYFKDAEGRYVLDNRAHLEFIGATRFEDIIGKTVFDFFPSEEAALFSDDEMKVIHSGEPLLEKEEIVLNRNKNEKRWHLTSKIPLVDNNGNITGVIGIDHDITKRKRSDERMNMLAQMVQDVRECISITDIEDRYIFVNDAFIKTYGYSEVELIGNSIEIIRSPLNDPEVTKNIRPKTLAGGWKGELINRRKGGIDFPISLSTTPLRDANGEIIGMVGVATDITEFKQSEEKLRQLSQAVEQSPATIIITDITGSIQYVNPRFTEVTGYGFDEVIGKNPRVLKSGHTSPDEYLKLWKTLTIGAQWHGEFQNKKKNGELFWESATISPIKNELGETTHFLAVKEDITEHKRAEEVQVNERLLLRTLIDNIPDSIYSKDLNCRKTLANTASVRNVGAKSEAEVLGKDDFAFFPKEIAEKFFASDQLVIQTGTPVLNKEEYILDEKGEKRWLLSTKLPLYDKDKHVIGLVGIGRDITEHKRAEEVLVNERLLLRTLIDNIPDAIYSKDLACRKTLTNAADLKNMGLTSGEDVMGKNDFDLFPKELAEKFYADDQLVLQTGKAVLSREEFIMDEKGEKRWLLTSKLPLRDRNDQIIGLVGIAHDITVRKQAEDAIRENERFLKETQIIAELGTYTMDITSGKWKSSEVLDTIFGIDGEYDRSVEGWGSIIHPEWQKIMTDYFIQVVMGTKSKFDKEYKIIRRTDNSERWVHGIGEIKFNEKNQPITMVGTIKDITEKKQAEKVTEVLYEISKAIYSTVSINELFQSIHNLLSSIIPADNLFIALLTKNGKALSFPYAKDEFDKNLEDWTDMDLFNSQSLTVEVLDTEQSLLLNVVQLQERYSTGRNKVWGTEPKCWLGIPLMLRENAIGVMVVQDYHNGYAYNVKDVAILEMAATQIAIAIERKQSEESLLKSEERFRSVTKSANDAIITSDSMGIIIDWNKGAEKIFGYQEEEIVGRYLTKIMPQHYVEQHSTGLERMSRSGDKHIIGKTVEVHGLHKNGNQFPIEISISQWETDSGKFFTAIIRNITERKKAEEEFKRIGEDLQETNSFLEEATARANHLAEQAEMASIAKSEFLANMSHEIRTPMNGVIGMTGLLLDTDLNDEQRRYAVIVRASGESLLCLINDILDFSKIEAKKLDLETIDFDLSILLDDFASALAMRSAEKGLELLCTADPVVPTLLRGDPGRLRQILTNLVGNAIKFTESGEVAVRVSLMVNNENDVLLNFSVRDTGIGIPKDKIGLLFGKFSQVDASTTRKYGGTGLGLAISKQLAELMGGDAGVKSEEGKGSDFWFTVRFGKQEVGKQGEIIPPANLRDLRVLIVDDNATNREILNTRLTSWGMRPSEAEDGPSALKLLYRSLDENDPFKISVIDMQMPEMDGEELGRIIKGDKRISDTRMILLTSLGSHGKSRHYKEIGFAAFATKPIRHQELKSILSMVIKDNDGTELMQQLIETPTVVREKVNLFAGRKSRILLAEDNITNQQVALGILKKFGLTADAVANGEEAVNAIKTIPYDLVLMDVQMPIMDGMEATRQIRIMQSSLGKQSVPIIAMTAHAMQGDREICLNAGMNDYVTKPVSPKALSDVLDRWLPKETMEISEPSSVVPEIISTVMVLDTELPVFDWPGMMSRMMDDEDFAKEMVGVFLNDAPLEIAALKDCLETGDVAGVERQAHSIKGAAASVGGERLRAVAFQMEKDGKAKDLVTVKANIRELEMQYTVLKEAMEKKL